MKLLFLTAFAFFSMKSSATEDLVLKDYQRLCRGKDNCRINIIPNQTQDYQGICQGTVLETVACEVIYLSTPDLSGLKIACLDTTTGQTIVEQTVAADYVAYNISVITTRRGEERFSVDPKSYYFFSHHALQVHIAEYGGRKEGSMSVFVDGAFVPFSRVNCR